MKPPRAEKDRELKKIKKQFEALRRRTENSKEPVLKSAPQPRRRGWTREAALAEENAWRGATSTISRNQQ